jgi:hypothetical protein
VRRGLVVLRVNHPRDLQPTNGSGWRQLLPLQLSPLAPATCRDNAVMGAGE